MSMNINFKVKYTENNAPAMVDEAMRRLMVFSGAELLNIFVYESKQRADGLGGVDGAKDTGELSNSIQILSIGNDHVTVGSPLKRARKLAFGEKDPGASLERIFKWRKRKNVPRRSKQVWEKVTTKGPTPNPFHERTEKRFLERWPRIQKEAKL